MFDTDILLSLGLSNHLISMWQVFLYIAILVPFLMLQRVKFCLLITYIYTYYLAYIIYWGDIIMSADTLDTILPIRSKRSGRRGAVCGSVL